MSKVRKGISKIKEVSRAYFSPNSEKDIFIRMDIIQFGWSIIEEEAIKPNNPR